MKNHSHIWPASLFLFVIHAIGGPADLTNAIHFTPPADFHAMLMTDQNTDPGDNPLSLDGPEFLSYVKYVKNGGDGGQIIFQRGLIRAYVGNGKVAHFMPVTPSLLKDELQDAWKNIPGDRGPATVDTIDGLTVAHLFVSRSLPANPRFLHYCWVQIEGNEALKITAFSSDTNVFSAMTDSLKSLKIDKRRYFEALNFTNAIVSTNQLERVELGYVRTNGAPFGFCVLHAGQKTYSFMIWFGMLDKVLEEPEIYFKRLEDCSAYSNSLRIAVIDFTSKYGPNTINIAAETNATEVAKFQIGDVGSPVFQLGSPYMSVIYHFEEDRIPDGFEKVAEYKVNATLYIRK